MEQPPQPHEPLNPLLEQAELEPLLLSIASVLVAKGEYEPNPSAYTPEGQPEALMFRIKIDPRVAKEAFYPEEDAIEILEEPEEIFLTYSTPHVLAREEIGRPSSNVYLELTGQFKGTGVVFHEVYRVAAGEASRGIYTGSVERDYERDGNMVSEELIEIDGTLLILTSEYRDLRLNDAEKLRRLLDRL